MITVSITIFSIWLLPLLGGAKDEVIPPGIIVFQTDRDGNDEIYLTDPRGSQFVRLTKNDSSDQYPRLSPDRRQVVFMSDRDGNMEIYRMDISGRNQTRLTHHGGSDQQPSWSPGGDKIIFCSDREGGMNLFTIKPDGSELKQLTHYQQAWCGSPVSSPDGKRIALTFKSSPRGRWRAAVLELSDSKIWKISPARLGNCRPAWSPAGKEIAFVKHESRSNTEICLSDLESLNFIRLTTHPDKDYNPAFSPDGKEIVFQSLRDSDRYQLFILDRVAGSVRRLTSSRGNDGNPDWR